MNFGGHGRLSLLFWFSAFFLGPNRFFFFVNNSSVDSGGGNPILVWGFFCEWEGFPLTKPEEDEVSILSREDDDNEDDELVRLSSVGVVANELTLDERWARYFDGWNERIGKRTGREDFIQRLFDNWKRFMWKI